MKAHGVSGPRAVPAAALRVVESPGRTLEMATVAAMEGRFGHDFSRIRVHDDGEAAESAGAVRARAYAVGPHLVFARGSYAPGTRRGDALLAHELAHAVQHDRHPGAAAHDGASSTSAPDEREADRAAARVARGRFAGPISATPTARLRRADDAISFFEHLFGQFQALRGEDFTPDELRKYLGWIREHHRIEGEMDSDDKAVQIVREWKKGDSQFELSNEDRALLIGELLDGPTTADDEEAIVEILERSDNAQLDAIWLGPATPEQIAEDVPDDEESALAEFCRWRWEGGIEAFRKGAGRPLEGSQPIPLGIEVRLRFPVQEKPPAAPQEKTPSWSPGLVDGLRAIAAKHGGAENLSFSELVDFVARHQDSNEVVAEAVSVFQRNGLLPREPTVARDTRALFEKGLQALVEIAGRVAAFAAADELARPSVPAAPEAPLGAPALRIQVEANLQAFAERHGGAPGLSLTELVNFLMSNKDVQDFVPEAVLELQRNGLIPPGSIEMGTKMGIEEGFKAGLKALVELAAGPATKSQPSPTGPATTISDPLKPTTILPELPIPLDPQAAVRPPLGPTISIRKAAYTNSFKFGELIMFEFTLPDYFRGRAGVDVVEDGTGRVMSSTTVEGNTTARTARVRAPSQPGRYRLRIRPFDHPDSTTMSESGLFGLQP